MQQHWLAELIVEHQTEFHRYICHQFAMLVHLANRLAYRFH